MSQYDLVDWAAARDQCSPLDRYKFAAKPKVLDYLFGTGPLSKTLTHSMPPAILNAYEKVHNPTLRVKALDMCLDHIRFEDKFTKWICIGPVNKAFNMLSIFFAEGPDSENFKNHQARIDDYLWLAADGMKMQVPLLFVASQVNAERLCVGLQWLAAVGHGLFCAGVGCHWPQGPVPHRQSSARVRHIHASFTHLSSSAHALQVHLHRLHSGARERA